MVFSLDMMWKKHLSMLDLGQRNVLKLCSMLDILLAEECSETL